MTLAATSFWDDWLKFTPGWLAFLATAGTWIYKAWVRRHHVALGADPVALRAAVEAARTHFEDITSAGGKRADWFQDEERRDTDRTIEDLRERLSDERLRTGLTGVIAAWRVAFGHAPPRRILGGYIEDYLTARDRKEAQEDQERYDLQIQAAQAGLSDAQLAVRRLNELERKTIGRS
ncbi:hypothetical protein [Streptomyces sp. MZ04]|uniref:hypothetical protein n=1 Tax=Streptomyces sp. MZ04 TaxID=2559236 RepID=UPI00107E76C0|nr:hypothetical protein [Streptomyces sp. MZ04]TGB03200.1 hypothetical protein E2651_25835 [Streptomyces sp. MZ04]